jgi:predicted ATP-dependent endonuclease of OLD family
MKLHYVTIKNFRSIESARIDFIPSCRALIGINESGKTNILHALRLLSGEFDIAPDDVREPGRNEPPIDEAMIRFVFQLTKLDKQGISNSIWTSVLAPSKTQPFIEATNDSLTQVVESIQEGLYRVDLIHAKRSASYWKMKDEEICEGWVVPKATVPGDLKISVPSQADRLLKSIAIAHLESLPQELHHHFEPLSIEQAHKFIGQAVTKWVDSHLPDCLMWSYNDSKLLPPVVPVAEFSNNPAKYETLKQMFLLAGVTDIAGELKDAAAKRNGMRNLLHRVAEAATGHMISVWREYKDIGISIEPNGSNIEISIQDKFNLYDFSRRSDGFKRFITFLFLVSAKTKNRALTDVLYLHDEPDSGLHPSGAKHLLKELVEVSKDNYVVFSTHSIFMIDSKRIDRHYLVRKEKEKTVLTTADSSNFRDEEVLFNALNFSAFEVLRQVNLLFEGWKDKRLFETATSGKSVKAKNLAKRVKHIGFCHAQGVKDVPKVSSLLEMARRDWVVISDGDKVAVEQQKKYEWRDRWFRYDEFSEPHKIETSEDFISSERVIVVLSKVCKRIGVQFDRAFELADEGKLKSIRNFLNQHVKEESMVSGILTEVKNELIDGLKADDIRDCYYSAMDSIVGRLEQLTVTPKPAC